jgi:hypothetical protein
LLDGQTVVIRRQNFRQPFTEPRNRGELLQLCIAWSLGPKVIAGPQVGQECGEWLGRIR